MPWGNLNLVTVENEYVGLNDGALAATGTVTFEASVWLQDPVDGITFFPVIIGPIALTNGGFSVQVPATNDPDVTPTGFTYKVTEDIEGVRRIRNIEVPYDQPGGVLNLSAVTDAVGPIAGEITYVAQSVFNTLSGVVDTKARFDEQYFNTPGTFTWTKPSWATANAIVEVELVAGGSGGGSGRRGAAASLRTAGAGGAGGGKSVGEFLASDLGATEQIVIGAGGAGGAAVTVDDTDGNAGVTGGASTFGTTTLMRCNSGTAGGAGNATGAATGGSAGGGSSISGSGGGSSATGGNGSTGGSSLFAGSGGGGGGGVTTGNSAGIGGAGGYSRTRENSGAPLGGQTTGAAGSSDTVTKLNSFIPGFGGGGGAGNSAGAGGAGAAGVRGGGGAGGGSSVNGFASGAGGNGGNGYGRVTTRNP